MKLSGSKIKLFFILFSPLLLLVIAACQTDYRVDAVEKARKYALKNTKDLSETDRNFIRYSDPEIMTDLIFSSKVPAKTYIGGSPNRFDSYDVRSNPKYDYMHTAFVWKVPKAGFSVLVDGSGERNMRGWDPDYIIYKKFIPENTAFAAAHLRAVSFLVNFFPDLDFRNINQVRFNEPQVFPTKFYLASLEEQSQEKQVKKWMDYIKTGKGLDAEPAQISLIWTSPVNGEKIVVCGTAPQENLNAWSPKKALLITSAELEDAVRKNVTVDIKDPKNARGEQIITPELNEHKTIEMKTPQRPKIKG